MDTFEATAVAAAGRPTTVADAALVLVAVWDAKTAAGRLSGRTRDKYVKELDAFVAFLAAHSVIDLGEVTPELCLGWIHAPISADHAHFAHKAGAPPSPATARVRQVIVRAAVKVWASAGWVPADLYPFEPIRGKKFPIPVPLTPFEVTSLRMSGRTSPTDTLRPVLVELTLAGVTRTEIARLTIADFDSESGQVHLPGQQARAPRVTTLDQTGVQVLTAHVDRTAKKLRRNGERVDPAQTPLGLRANAFNSPKDQLPIEVAANLRRAFTSAGITRRGVRVASIEEYAANRHYALTNRIEDVAAFLGMGSLDAAMRLIDPTWQTSWAEYVREAA